MAEVTIRCDLCEDFHGPDAPCMPVGFSIPVGANWPTREEWEEHARRLESPAYRSSYGRWSNYHISLDDFEEMQRRQEGSCAICHSLLDSSDSRRVHVDHDHACAHPGKGTKSCRECVRGILCHRCNMLVGWIENNRPLLPAVHAYLDAPRPLANAECPVAGCATRIPPYGKPLCSPHWRVLPTQIRGRFWDGRMSSPDIAAYVDRKLAALAEFRFERSAFSA